MFQSALPAGSREVHTFDAFSKFGDGMRSPFCPSCGLIFEKLPKRESKCIVCGERLFVHNGNVISEAERLELAQRARNSFPATSPCPRCGETQWEFESLSPNEKSAKWVCGYCGRKVIIRESPNLIHPKPLIKKPGVGQSPALSWVYFIEAVGLNKIKIGTSDDPEKRLRELATGSAVPLRILAKMQGNVELETTLHRRFEHLRFDREWFHATKELLTFIAGLSVRSV
jgi:DNA-directed RNA polymerase subunit RPC12/RpoP